MKIILLGAPGVGKGTQAKLISAHYKIPHISTGDIFRSHISGNTPLGIEAKEYIKKGQLVPDSITISIVSERLSREDCDEGFLLDGFPRSLNQARELGMFLEGRKQYIDRVFNISVPEEFIIQRITGRRFCEGCGASYHVRFNPPKTEGRCDNCGKGLLQRNDDREDIIKDRLSVYNGMTKPLIEYYSNLGVLYNINGDADIQDIFHSICSSFEAV